jgi:hypothetical protein
VSVLPPTVPTFADMLGDRQYVSQYAIDTVGFVVHKDGVVADADGNLMTVTMASLDWDPANPTAGGSVLFTRDALHTDVGTYEIILASTETARPGLWKVIWDYALAGVPQTFVGVLEVGLASPAYDNLPDEYKGLIEKVWVRFADLFDSPLGGPHLQVYFQSRFTRGRMAQLLDMAMGELNTAAQPWTTYSITAGNFPLDHWGALLEKALYIEALKHLIRSYNEQPMTQGLPVVTQDRTHYVQQWRAVLADEMPGFRTQLDVFKIASMGLGRASALVSGGVYGSYGPTRIAGSAAARPRYWSRFYS